MKNFEFPMKDLPGALSIPVFPSGWRAARFPYSEGAEKPGRCGDIDTISISSFYKTDNRKNTLFDREKTSLGEKRGRTRFSLFISRSLCKRCVPRSHRAS